MAGDQLARRRSTVGAAPGDHRELRIKALEVELAHHALVALLHEEAPGAGLELLLDEPELALGEPEPVAVVLRVRIGVRERTSWWGSAR